MKPKDRKTTIREDIVLVSKWLETVGNRDSSGITVKQVQLLELIGEQPVGTLTLTTLAAQAGSSRQNVKKIADILERKGQIVMERDPSDARVLRISLSESGKALLDRRKSMQDRHLSEVFNGIDEKTLKIVAKALVRMKKNCVRIERRDATDSFLVDDAQE